MTIIITDPAFAPARQLIEERFKAVKDGRIKIGSGPGMDDTPMGHDPMKPPPNKTLCIMEVTAYILGYKISDEPPCTSATIRDFLIQVNDLDITMRKRAMLKELIEHIVNTAPTRWVPINRRKDAPLKLVTHSRDPRYRAAEKQRKEMLNAWKAANDSDDWGSWDEMLADGKITMKSVIDLVKQMVEIAKFDTENEKTEMEVDNGVAEGGSVSGS